MNTDNPRGEAPRSAIAAQVLILINAVFWLGFALIAALGCLPGSLSGGPGRWIFFILAAGVSVTMGLLVFLSEETEKSSFLFGFSILCTDWCFVNNR